MKYLATVMMKYKFLFLIVFAFAKANFSQAQSQEVKLEKEERIKSTDFPADAVPWILRFAGGKRIKFYKEFDGDKTSYEGKFKKNGRRYSMEYSKDGNLEDVEIEIQRKEIEKNLWETMEGKLDSIDDRWRVEKIQQQYRMPEEGYDQLLQHTKNQNFQYLEIIVAFKNNRKIYSKELLFDREGTIIRKREVKRRAYDFLLF
jgi:hypothetical protein